ncbi:MAG: methyltransferase domain-containing protein [Anaerolineales bacterium]
MDTALFNQLLTPAGQTALADAAALEPTEDNFLRHYQSLARQHPADLARAALEQAILRRAAAAKFPRAAQMYFTRPALEQATAWQISHYRMSRYRGVNRIFDFACSIGGDAIPLADAAPVCGFDLDPLRLAIARENARTLQPPHPIEWIQANLTAALPLSRLSPQSALFFDPARRDPNGRRAFSVAQYQPPLSVIHHWLPNCPNLGVKLSPGVNLQELAQYPAEVEFISLGGELKEAVLWFGGLQTATRRATRLPEGISLTPQNVPPLPIVEPRAYLAEPDPAILRAGLVQTLGAQVNAAQLDPEIAYLTADAPVESPFLRWWQIDFWMPFQLKRLRAALREHRIGTLTIKKRGSPLVPEELLRALKLTGDQQRVLFLTQSASRPVAIVCFSEEITRETAANFPAQ